MPVPTTAAHMLPSGGDAAVKKPKQQLPLVGNEVKRIQDGNTLVIICDDFCAKTPEEVEKVEAEFMAASWVIAQRLIDQGVDV